MTARRPTATTEPARGWCVDVQRWLAARWFLQADASWFPRLYEVFFTASPWGRRLRVEEHQAIAAELQLLLCPGQHVMEVGSGTGDYTRLLHDFGVQVSARDGSPAMVAYLRRRLRREHRDVDVQLAVLPEGLHEQGGAVVEGHSNVVGAGRTCPAAAPHPSAPSRRRAGSWSWALMVEGSRR